MFTGAVLAYTLYNSPKDTSRSARSMTWPRYICQDGPPVHVLKDIRKLTRSRHKTLNQCLFNVGPTSCTVDQRYTNIVSVSAEALFKERTAGCFLLIIEEQIMVQC